MTVSVRRRYAYPLAVLLIASVGCSPLRQMNNDDVFLAKQEIKLPDNLNKAIEIDAFSSGFRIAPNTNFLGIRIPMRLHGLIRRNALETTIANREQNGRSEGGIRWWLSERIGEAPARFDSALIDRTALNIEFICKQMGYLDATCIASTDLSRHRIARVVYDLAPGMLWTLGSVSWSDTNANLSRYPWRSNTLMQKGDAFAVDVLEAERNRIARDLRNLGFASIQASHVNFLADTLFLRDDRQVRVEIEISPDGKLSDGQPKRHKQARFGEVTWSFDGEGQDSLLDPDVVSFLMSIEKNMRFNEKVLHDTQLRLTELPCISRVDIPGAFNGIESDELVYDVNVILHSAKRFGMTTAIDMTRTDARYGPILSWSLMDRLARRRGDEWDVHVSGGLTSTRPFSYSNAYLVPNSATWSVEAHYSALGIPPLALTSLRPSNRARTDFAFNWARENRPEYAQNSLILKWGFHFIENPRRMSEIRVDILELRRTKIENEKNFQGWLDAQLNPFLTARFQDYASLLSRVDWRSDWSVSRRLSGTFRIQAEWTGWALKRLANAWEWETNEAGQRLLGNIPFAHYFRTEAEWIWKLDRRKRNGFSWHGRARGGWAVNGSNFNGIPFDRSFFAGGANGLRGWNARDLGPGFGNPENFEGGFIAGLGDLQGECSLEARKSMTQVLEMALFTDVGNVWLQKAGSVASNEALDFDFKSLAWGAGVGMRLDFEFFVFRLDGSLRLHDPTRPDGSRWLSTERLDGALHLGIGYPF